MIDDDPDAVQDDEIPALLTSSDDRDRLIGYGWQHRDTWGGIRVDGDRVVIAFTDPGGHRDAINRLVEHPDPRRRGASSAIQAGRTPATGRHLRCLRGAAAQQPHRGSLLDAAHRGAADWAMSQRTILDELLAKHGVSLAVADGA